MSDAVVDDGHRDSNWAGERKDMDASNNAGVEHPDNGGDYHASSDANVGSGSKGEQPTYPKQLKPNKVYIGGLPEHTRKEDLENCFGKIGNIINIELKVGYGFVEFDNSEAADESVAKYNEGFFMGNKIRVEISHGGGRAASFNREPGACFRCGQMGHWARECPNYNPIQRRTDDAPLLIDRIDRGPRDYAHPRDARYEYPPQPMVREYRRPNTPPRDYRDYPPRRDYDDYRRGSSPDRYGPPPDYRSRYLDPYRGYGPPPPAPYPYDRHDRRDSKYSYPPPPPPPPIQRPRTPPRYRDEYDRPPPRDEYRSRTPVRYPDYPRGFTPERLRRRSKSPPARGPPPFEYSQNSVPPPVNGNFPDNYPGGPPRSGRDYPTPPPRNGDVYRRT